MNLTVGQYQQLYFIHKTETDELERSIRSIGVVTGKTQDEIEEMPVKDFNTLSREINKSLRELQLNPKPSNFLAVGRKLYQINYKISTLTAGQVIEVNHWLKGDVIENMDKILASISVPIKRYWWVKLPAKVRPAHEAIAEDIQGVSFAEAYGSVVFFCALFSSSIKAILPYLETEIAKVMTPEETQKFKTDLMKVLDGYTMSNVSPITNE
jgi:hypothetical protein